MKKYSIVGCRIRPTDFVCLISQRLNLSILVTSIQSKKFSHSSRFSIKVRTKKEAILTMINLCKFLVCLCFEKLMHNIQPWRTEALWNKMFSSLYWIYLAPCSSSWLPFHNPWELQKTSRVHELQLWSVCKNNIPYNRKELNVQMAELHLCNRICIKGCRKCQKPRPVSKKKSVNCSQELHLSQNNGK